MILKRWQAVLAYATQSFPIVTRELIEQANRRRTFVLRFIFVLVTYGVMWIRFWSEIVNWSNDPMSAQGSGAVLFDQIALLQFMAIYLLQPAMSCGVITTEKERDTLSILLLTRLGPSSILLGKLFSRLIPMWTFLLLMMPLYAVAYSFGGVELADILSLAWCLFATSVQLASLSLALSAWCRTTALAFIATYVLGGALIAAPIAFTHVFYGSDWLDLITEIAKAYGWLDNSQTSTDVGYLLLAPMIVPLLSGTRMSFGATLHRTVPIFLFAACALLFARFSLWRRAFVKPSNLLMKLFHAVDRQFHIWNQNKWTRGIVLTSPDSELPIYDPIRWRETRKRSLGTTRYLVRVLLFFEVVVVLGLAFGMGEFRFIWVPAAAWIFAALLIAMQSAGVIGAEKSRQTLDVLLTTPLTSERIIEEKFAGIWRLIFVLWVPFVTIILFQIEWVKATQESERLIPFFLLRGIFSTLIYPPLVASIGFFFGMRCRSQSQATVFTVGSILILSTIPRLARAFDSVALFWFVWWISPISVLITVNDLAWQNEYLPVFAEPDFAGLFTHFTFWGIILWKLRNWNIQSFPHLVQRNDGANFDDASINRLSSLRSVVFAHTSNPDFSNWTTDNSQDNHNSEDCSIVDEET